MTDDICDIASDQATAWRDALNDEDMEDARSVPRQQPQPEDAQMYYNIHAITGHLNAKARQLLGKSHSTMYMHAS